MYRAQAARCERQFDAEPRLTMEQPPQQRQDDTDEDAGGDREIEGAMLAPNENVAGKPTEPEPTKQRPQHTDNHQYRADDDKEATHRWKYGWPTRLIKGALSRRPLLPARAPRTR